MTAKRSSKAVPPGDIARDTVDGIRAEPKVALRIGLTAQRCPDAAPGKARFDCDGRALIVEDLVLRRWRQRRSPNETFHGCRLPPRTWDVARAVLLAGFAIDAHASVETLEQSIAGVRTVHPFWKPPAAIHFLVLLLFLKNRGLLQQILDRVRAFEKPGLPDLVLYRRGTKIQPHGFIFAEVKRSVGSWRERLSSAQASELQFLRSIGLKAGVVRILETPARSTSSTI